MDETGPSSKRLIDEARIDLMIGVMEDRRHVGV
jgi:hypothetical protein